MTKQNKLEWQEFFERISQLYKPPCVLMLYMKEDGVIDLIGAVSTTLEEKELDYIG